MSFRSCESKQLGHTQLGNFVRPDFERRKSIIAEGRRKSSVGRIAAAGHEDATDPGRIVARVESIPLSAQERLEPRAEIHGVGHWRHANIAQISGAVTGRNIHASAKGDGQMHKVAADADALAKPFYGGPSGAGLQVIKVDMPMHEVADRLHARPAGRGS